MGTTLPYQMRCEISNDERTHASTGVEVGAFFAKELSTHLK
jgi:hypothetical protein